MNLSLAIYPRISRLSTPTLMIPKLARTVKGPYWKKSRTWKMTSLVRSLKIENIIESASKGLLVSFDNTRISFKN